MPPKRITILFLLAVVFLITAILTWGSIGSGLCVYGLLMVIPSMLLEWFRKKQEDSDFDME